MSDPDLAELRVDAAVKTGLRDIAKRTLLGIQPQLDLLEPDTEIAAGIRATAAFGHTPGHMAVDVSSAGERLLFIADALADPIMVQWPEARCVTDCQPDHVVRTRRQILDHAAAQQPIISATHFPFPGLGHVSRDDSGDYFEWHPIASAKLVT
jgi:glyoxylase-like metal-dependent hydrolase (beta-lactamase superfamily II)